MKSVRWLQISDIHLSASQDWAQDVVLSSMLEGIKERRDRGDRFDFVLVTGDLAFSGKSEEYDRVEAILDRLVLVAGVDREALFFIPGNHDVDRGAQKTCFVGAIELLKSQNDIDIFLGDRDEIGTLSERLDAFREFQARFMGTRNMRWSAGKLGYCSLLNLDGLRITIVGLNTAWLCEGGLKDHGRLLIGERQVIDLLRIAEADDPHVIIAMGHHPFQVIAEFDRRVVQRRIEGSCHFYHCGHLHDPELRAVASNNSSCLTVAAGAAFETRHSHNAYSIVELDVMRSNAEVRTVQYNPSEGRFAYEASSRHNLGLGGEIAYSTSVLGQAIENRWPVHKTFSYYLAALLCGTQSEVPLFANGCFTFASLAVVEAQQESELKTVTVRLSHLSNLLRLLSREATPEAFLAAHGQPVADFAQCLDSMSKSDPTIAAALEMRDTFARSLAGASETTPFSHTAALLEDLVDEGDWTALAEQARRSSDAVDPALRKLSRRMLARAMAESGTSAGVEAATLLYDDLVETGEAEEADFAGYAALFARVGDFDRAKVLVMECVSRYPDSVDRLATMAHSLVVETGDRAFRDEFRALPRSGQA